MGGTPKKSNAMNQESEITAQVDEDACARHDSTPPSRDENHDESRLNGFDEETAVAMGACDKGNCGCAG